MNQLLEQLLCQRHINIKSTLSNFKYNLYYYFANIWRYGTLLDRRNIIHLLQCIIEVHFLRKFHGNKRNRFTSSIACIWCHKQAISSFSWKMGWWIKRKWPSWFKWADIKNKRLIHIVIFVVGNKTDLYDKEEVKTQEGAQYAKVRLLIGHLVWVLKDLGALFKLTSAKMDTGITVNL